MSSKGTLWLVATPLGNPGDLSPRARKCLVEAHLVLAEDTRRAGLACKRWGLECRRFLSVHDHNEEKMLAQVLARLDEGHTLALISDAGMPVLADPGYLLVRACREAGHRVSAIPGPCAPVTALAASGLPPQPFVFFGFLPRSKGDQRHTLAPYAGLQCTLVFFERKDRVQETLALAGEVLGPREVCVARELTKTFEEFLHFSLQSVPNLASLKGELTVVIGPPQEAGQSTREQVQAILMEEMTEGGTPRQIARRAQTRCRGWSGGDVYALMLEIKG